MTPLFVELCAGLASVSGCLQHGSRWKPPVSRMGRKTGYAAAILRVMGLRPGGKAGAFLWAEADGDVAALLAAYTQPEKMREIAAIIRSWIPCPYGPHEVDPSCSRCKGTGRWDARDLWETLRREERRGLWEGAPTPEEVAAWSVGFTWTHPVQPRMFCGPGHSPGSASNGLTLPSFGNRFAALPWPPVLIAQDAAVDVGSVAGWVWHTGRSIMGGGGGFADTEPRHDGKARPRGLTLESFAAGCAPRVWPPTALTPSALLPVPPIPPGTVVYIDPPYVDTTGYKHDFDRAAVIEAAQRWASAGARVYISEAEPVPIPGWFHVEIGSERIGQARTFGNTREWLTCSVPPAWTPPKQGALW